MKLKDLKINKGKFTITSNLTIIDKTTYLRLEINDGTLIVINMFSNDPHYETFEKLPHDALLLVDIELEYKGKNSGNYDTYQIHSVKVKERPSLVDVVDINKLKNELRNIIHNIENVQLKNLICNVFADKELAELFFNVPCTERSAYSFKGGILAHSVRVCRLIDSISDTFDNWEHNNGGFNEKLDTDLLKTVAILHDIGRSKMHLFNVDNVIEKTLEGELISNTEESVLIFKEAAKETDLTKEQIMVIQHIISASGSNSQCLPRTKEALVFNQIEKLDIIMGNFEYMQRVNIGNEFQKLLDKNYCLIDFNEI